MLAGRTRASGSDPGQTEMASRLRRARASGGDPMVRDTSRNRPRTYTDAAAESALLHEALPLARTLHLKISGDLYEQGVTPFVRALPPVGTVLDRHPWVTPARAGATPNAGIYRDGRRGTPGLHGVTPARAGATGGGSWAGTRSLSHSSSRGFYIEAEVNQSRAAASLPLAQGRGEVLPPPRTCVEPPPLAQTPSIPPHGEGGRGRINPARAGATSPGRVVIGMAPARTVSAGTSVAVRPGRSGHPLVRTRRHETCAPS